MIAISIKNYRGCESAELAVDGIALVAGRNGAGKSSICGGVASVLTGLVMPPGMKKGDAKQVVRDGVRKASVSLTTEDGNSEIQWPKLESSSEGDAVTATEIAAGLVSIPELDAKARTILLSLLLKAAPQKDDLVAACVEAGIGEATGGKLWDAIVKSGWDGAYAGAREKGATLKGQWLQATGETYGLEKAADWAPADWRDELEDITPIEADERVEEKRQARDKAVAAAAVDRGNVAALRAAADAAQARQIALHLATEDAREAEAALQAARTKRAALPAASASPGLPCPHCGEPVEMRQIRGGEWQIAKTPPKISDAEIKARALAIADADGEVERLRAAATEKVNAQAKARHDLDLSRQAQASLDKMGDVASGSAADLDAAKEAFNIAVSEQRMIKAKREADRIRDLIVANQAVIDILAPAGIRKTRLARAVETFNVGMLASLSEAASWPIVAMTEDMEFTAGGRAYALLSASEKWRVRTILQVAAAQLDGSKMLVIDAADILDAPGRNGLFGLLAHAGIDALVTMTMNKPEQVPDLAAAKIGTSYWIERGAARRVGSEPAAEAAE